MTKNELKHAYFDWMCQLVYDDRYLKRLSYRKLLTRLNEIDFNWVIPMDADRAADGTDLRYRFGYENSYEGPVIANCLDDRPCSVLEMMIALAVRCEEHIMENTDEGDRTGQWFWNMIVSLGLGTMTDDRYDERFVDMAIDQFMYRKYASNGEGSLFTVHDPNRDMRSINIWYQMCLYLDEII